MKNCKTYVVSDLEKERKEVISELERSVISFLKLTRGMEPCKETKKKIKKAVSEYTKAGSRTQLLSVNELAATNVKVVKPRVKLSNKQSMFSKADDNTKQSRDSKGRFTKEFIKE